MAESSKKPRVFISYARNDGETYAFALRKRLEAAGVPLWQDRSDMQGGKDWWFQIVEALNTVDFVVMVLTSEALKRPIVRKEWRYARQQGVCVLPVKADPALNFENLPRWMRDIAFYDLDSDFEWTKFLNDLSTRCEQERVPFMVEDLPGDFVERPHEFQQLIAKLLDEQREEPVAITAALRGAGGFGKTTMAKAICHDEDIQNAFDDGILWVTLGENPGNLIGKVEDLIYILNREQPHFSSIDAAVARFSELLEDRDILLVIDDVWNSADLKPFLQGGKRTARLITTRDDHVLTADVQRIPVDAMQQDEAVQLLRANIPPTTITAETTVELQKLATRLGEWALLLKLVNRALVERIGRGETLAKALDYINKALDKRGLTFFDSKNLQDRSQAVAKTLSVSFELLSPEDRTRYQELAVFPEDIDIPLETIEKFWHLDFETDELCNRLYSLSLLLNLDFANRTARFHDVFRAYLRHQIGAEKLIALDTQLLDAYTLTRWADLPHTERYLWNHLIDHLTGAGRIEEAVATIKDGTYLATKAFVRTPYALETDLAKVEQQAPSDSIVILLRHHITNMEHVLHHCVTLNEVQNVLYSRLIHVPELAELCNALQQELARPYIVPWYPLPDLPDNALIRTLTGHSSLIFTCAISSDSRFIVSGGAGKTLRVWDVHTGTQYATLLGHTGSVNACAISPDGTYIVSASDDQTLKIWTTQDDTFVLHKTLSGHVASVRDCAISPDGMFLVSASHDKTVKIWNVQSGMEIRTLAGHTDYVNGCAISSDGTFIVSASGDATLKMWNTQSGAEIRTLSGHSSHVTSCAMSRDDKIIVSTSSDYTLKIWDAQTGAELRTLIDHSSFVNSCAISPDSKFIVSTSNDHSLKVWDVDTGEKLRTLLEHTYGVNCCTLSQDGQFLVSASNDTTIKIWNAHAITEGENTASSFADWQKNWIHTITLSPTGEFLVPLAPGDTVLKVYKIDTKSMYGLCYGHTGWLQDCAFSPDASFVVSASDDQKLIVWNAHSSTAIPDIFTDAEPFTFAQRFVLSGHSDKVRSCTVSPNNDFIVSTSNDHTLKIWDAQTGVEVRTLIGHSDTVNSCAISPDGTFIVSASSDGTLKVWDVQSGALLQTLAGHTNYVNECAISPDGTFIVSTSGDTTLRIWDIQTGKTRLTLTGHKHWIYGCVISPDGKRIASVSWDCTLKLWDARTGACLASFPVSQSLSSCAFCHDNEHIILAGKGGVYFLRVVW